jgi:hypothetical protein
VPWLSLLFLVVAAATDKSARPATSPSTPKYHATTHRLHVSVRPLLPPGQHSRDATGDLGRTAGDPEVTERCFVGSRLFAPACMRAQAQLDLEMRACAPARAPLIAMTHWHFCLPSVVLVLCWCGARFLLKCQVDPVKIPLINYFVYFLV